MRQTRKAWMWLCAGWLLWGTAVAKQPEISVGGQVRVRSEARRHSYFTSDLEDQAFTLQRTRLHVGVTMNPHIKVYVQLQDSRAWGEEPSTAAALGNTDVHQGYIDVLASPAWTFRLGRQSMIFGEERLVGAFEWNNTGRAFDGLRVMWRQRTEELDVFYTTLAEDSFTPAPNDDHFFGANLATRRTRSTTEVFTFGRTDQGALDFLTVGVREEFTHRGLALGGELAIQTGNPFSVENSHSAVGVIGKVGYTFQTDFKPHLGFEYVYASGDDDGGQTNQRFDQLFPTNHGKYGFIDYVGWRNLNAFKLSFALAPADKWATGVELHIFRLAKKGDAWFRASGAALRPSPGTANIGQELDLYVQGPIAGALGFAAGYSHFFLGDLAPGSGNPGVDSDWAFGMFTVNF